MFKSLLGAGNKKQDIISAFKEFLLFVKFPLPAPKRSLPLFWSLAAKDSPHCCTLHRLELPLSIHTQKRLPPPP